MISSLLGLLLEYRYFPPASLSTSLEPNSDNSPRELTAADLKKFLDDLVPARLERDKIAGAEVLVVKDGQILLSQGYGLADVKTGRPMSPQETVIRPGSVSKLFTWTAVMQQVELGQLDLDRDVNDYLDFKIPEAFGQPITLRQIMTHTAGFEETFKQLVTHKAERLVSLESYVKNNLPARIYPPGELTAYSTYATSLAGYIVERISRQTFADYISDHIFAPLGMAHSTFAQPLPERLREKMGSGYIVASQHAQPYEFTNASPSGALATTAADLARFMISHLQDGRWGEQSIMKPATARLMHQPHCNELPGFGGFTLGFIDRTWNSHRIIGHPGNTLFWSSELQLIPEANVGFFAATNSIGRLGWKAPLLPDLFQAFLNRYFGCERLGEATSPTAASDALRVAGRYLPSRRSGSAVRRLWSRLIAPVVTANPDATIEVNVLRGTHDLAPIRWRAIGPLLYREEGGHRRLAFVPDSAGRIRYLAVDGDPTLIYQRAPKPRLRPPAPPSGKSGLQGSPGGSGTAQ